MHNENGNVYRCDQCTRQKFFRKDRFRRASMPVPKTLPQSVGKASPSSITYLPLGAKPPIDTAFSYDTIDRFLSKKDECHRQMSPPPDLLHHLGNRTLGEILAPAKIVVTRRWQVDRMSHIWLRSRRRPLVATRMISKSLTTSVLWCVIFVPHSEAVIANDTLIYTNILY